MGAPARPAKERFMEKVNCQEGDQCWLWTAGTNRHGYGLFNRATRPSKSTLAHRYSYELFVGPIPPGKCALHRCDNPRCVRPSHLFIGTRTDNANDKVAKGRARGPRGEKHPRATVTAATVVEVRRAATSGLSKREIAGRFRLPLRRVRAIVDRETWKHIPEEVSHEGREGDSEGAVGPVPAERTGLETTVCKG
jgi:hypothetical protein